MGAVQEVMHFLAHVSDQKVAHVGITCGSGNDLHFFPWKKQGGSACTAARPHSTEIY